MIADNILATDFSIAQKEIFSQETKNNYKKYIEEALYYVQEFLDKDGFYKGETSELISRNRNLASLNSLSFPQSIHKTLEEVKELYLDNAISFHAPNYVAHLNCPIVLPSIVAELISTSVNTAIETWDQSTSATFMEQEVIRFFCDKLKLSSQSDGVFTSGGTQSNFMAMLMARDNYALEHFGVNIKQNGWSPNISKFRIFCSDKSHFSIKKAAALLGMGYNSVITVATDDKMRMEPSKLALAIEKTKQEGNIPVAVVATLGTTDYGSFDPLADIITLAKENNMWVHVDGAYGGCFVLTQTHKQLFEAVEYADSMTLDFHKTLFQPVCCSAVLVNNEEHFKYVSYYADYLNPIEDKDPQRPNLIEKSIQTTRRFDALKVWMTLKTLGTKTIASYLEQVHFLAKEIHQIIEKDPFFETAHIPELSTIVFRYKALDKKNDADHNAINSYIKNTLFKSGKASVASTKLDGKLFLKFTLLNPNTTINHLIDILNLIKKEGEVYINKNK